MLGLPYPGGPLIDSYARNGDPEAFEFPGTDMPGLDFSFSGIKTAIMYFLRDNLKDNPAFIEENIADICASIQNKLIEMLTQKLILASSQTGINEIAIAGGVSANSGLREKMEELAIKNKWNLYVPKLEYCTDNAAMIAMAAYFKFQNHELSDFKVTPMPRMNF